jgi:hypothetical protein
MQFILKNLKKQIRVKRIFVLVTISSATILTILVFTGLAILKLTSHPSPPIAMSEYAINSGRVESIEADLLGTGNKQLVEIHQTDNEVVFKIKNNNEIIVSHEFSQILRPSTTYSVLQLNANNPKEYIRWDQIAGPHQWETLFITLHDSKLYTIPSGDFEKEVWYQRFWTSRDELIVWDINGDGLMEIIEFVDEYPPSAPRLEDEEIKNITLREFSKTHPEEIVGESAWKIVSRENYGVGRGAKVIWNIHTFVDGRVPMIRKLDGKEYSEYEDLLLNYVQVARKDQGVILPILVSKNDLSSDSIEFNNFVRTFWTVGVPNEEPMEL